MNLIIKILEAILLIGLSIGVFGFIFIMIKIFQYLKLLYNNNK